LALLEGLEISEIMFSELDHIKNRIDAEYYQKNFLEIDSKIKAIGETNLIKIEASLDCSAFYPSITEYYDFLGNGVPFLRVNEIKNGLVKLTESTAFLPQEILDRNTSTIAVGYPGDLIIAKGGNTLAKVGLITEQHQKYALSRDLILIRTNNLKEYNRYFLWLFLHSEYGQSLLWRTASQTGQPHLTLPSINEINLPKFDLTFEELAEKLYKRSIYLNDESKRVYREAEHLLLKELNLEKFKPSQEPVNVKSFADSFGTTGRLDAEYYQVKYEDYLKQVEDYTEGNDLISSLCHVKTDNYLPTDNTEYKYIELSNIGTSGEITGSTIDFGENLPSRARRLVSKGDVIVSSIEGSLDSCALVSDEYNGALCSTGFYVLNSKKINSQSMLVLMKSELMQNILKQRCSGTILTAINKDEFLNISIPIVSPSIQEKIAELVNENFEFKTQSEHLLEVAKRAVELAIEEDEQTALNWITEQTKA
tara:strand:- start:325 stop:1764 length:1440 start_codon:yes stop_codon:yes gene_type:complete